jgi:GTP-binding protein
VDISGSEGRDPEQEYEAVLRELRAHDPEILRKPRVVVANKCDLLTDERNLELLKARAGDSVRVFAVSGATTQGIKPMLQEISRQLETLPPVERYLPDYEPLEVKGADPQDTKVTRCGDAWEISGEWLSRTVASVCFSDYESRMYFDRVLRKAGIFDKLEKKGVQEGDTVRIFGMEFDYVR